jgi:hypothetical protein
MTYTLFECCRAHREAGEKIDQDRGLERIKNTKISVRKIKCVGHNAAASGSMRRKHCEWDTPVHAAT